ncbi:flagellar filament capping protein FliD [Neobacillus sp. PS3-34]|uniref:flagellar filament capping protein FliD n=1 Tax=Neobacillus sp. PS3-34 TaxID=3070678 RepID=UPI0027DEC2D2|nr:flagellar filament capping protein FliD [Neobacillus sp. PS3-34]WML46902.1 flagellar filament capping protein FliD [Neobacillus sp. PS3-34]
MTTMRISGIASGMDIDKMVGDLMKAERMPLDKLKQKKQVLEWQRDDYRSMNTLLLNFRTELTGMKMTTRYRARTTASTNEAQVTATASSAASQGSYSVSNVTQLATAATLKNGGPISADPTKKVDLNSQLFGNEAAFNSTSLNFGWKSGTAFSQSITASATTAGTPIALPTPLDGTLDLASVTVAVNNKNYEVVTSSATGLKPNQVYVNSSGAMTFGADIAAGSKIQMDYFTNNASTGAVNYSTFSVGSYTSTGFVKQNITFKGTDTLSQVISKVNASDTGVTMFYDSFSDQMTLTRKETGNFNGKDPAAATNPMTSADSEILTSGSFIDDVLKFKTVKNGGAAVESGGQDAMFTVNGLTTQRHTNTFDMNGVTFTLKQTFAAPVNVTINNDTNSVFDNIKGFIDKYNTLIDTVQKKTSEDYFRDYPPLTDDQKLTLSDKQQEQWEAKAKSGLIRQDPILNGVLNQMRSSFYAPVNNSQVNAAYNQLAKVGITTSANYLEGGKLQIDEAKLKAAIQADPTSVENLFRGSGTTSSDQGVIQRLYDNVTDTMDSLKQKAGNTFSTNKQFAIGLKLDSLGTQITSFDGRMKQVEDRYYRQFTAMEQAMQKANSQASYMQQHFAGGQ